MKIGDIFKFGRNEYTVVSTFVEGGYEYYVCKYKTRDGLYSYSNIFRYDEDENLFKHI